MEKGRAVRARFASGALIAADRRISGPRRARSSQQDLALRVTPFPLFLFPILKARCARFQTSIFPASDTPAPSTASGRILSSWAAPLGIIG